VRDFRKTPQSYPRKAARLHLGEQSRESRRHVSDGVAVAAALTYPPPAAPVQTRPPLEAKETIPNCPRRSKVWAAVAAAAGDRPVEEELEEGRRLRVFLLQCQEQDAPAFR
jgi:hypothetical protein